MRRFASDFHANNSETFRYGTIVALCSATIVAAGALANVLMINPDLLSSQIDEAIAAYGSMLDSNSLQAVDKVKGMMPEITFFSNLIYCFLFGLLLSFILSRNIPSSNPFSRNFRDMDNRDGDGDGTDRGQENGDLN